ncbi:hypothetical protein [Facklamia hominis]|uniref:hypothetical protein n=1 Tax=Facklamia hominis TaxID=178214 RepID=UPI0038FC6304
MKNNFLLSKYDNWLTAEDKPEYVVTEDWRGNEVWNYENDEYYSTELGLVRNETFEIESFMRQCYGAPETPEELGLTD